MLKKYTLMIVEQQVSKEETSFAIQVIKDDKKARFSFDNLSELTRQGRVTMLCLDYSEDNKSVSVLNAQVKAMPTEIVTEKTSRILGTDLPAPTLDDEK